MGTSWSSDRPEESSSSAADLEQNLDPPSQSKYPRCYGDVVPSVCSDRPEGFYDELYEQMYFVQHANQDCIVAFQQCEKENPRVDPDEWFIIAKRIPRVYEYLAHSTNTPNVDRDQPIDLHPYIVNSCTIWIRDDVSIALSGFLNATILTDECPYSPDGTRHETEIYYPTNPDTKRWAMPTDQLDPMEMPAEVNTWEYNKQRLKEGKLQRLEEERLGPMLVKAWNGEYENAREILQEVRSYVQQIGVSMDGEGEVLLDDGRKWEGVFTVVQTDGARWGREIRYK
ncbi:hypothetical protein BDV27DRAFT_151255 [Aspergillus caelatus]|uniref:Uncharacterized protein n=1 Tax=Aspergillus caelatus TaxID=61420 RepID=A0A5N6ZMY0_9EURO|nr:uncharacterized protein BDV27DRAFT_151255 [Aspergillus caelatus]KAE8357520.1 hypothetical protein BDV27DRAFT_151255 [Aspergillus caelatus]